MGAGISFWSRAIDNRARSPRPENSECYVVKDANGVTLACLYCRDDAQRYSFGVSKLSSDEARRIGKAIARIPEFLMPRQAFHPRGGGPHWRADRP